VSTVTVAAPARVSAATTSARISAIAGHPEYVGVIVTATPIS
jgi:hypothetical protein